MNEIAVGSLLDSNIKRYRDGITFNYTPSGAICTVFTSNASQREIKNTREGYIKFALAEIHLVLFFLIEIEGFLDWCDAPFSVHMNPPDKKLSKADIAHFAERDGLALHIILVEATTGIIKALRLITLKTNFSNLLNEKVLKQLDSAWDRETYQSSIANIYKKYSSQKIFENSFCKNDG